MTRSKHGAIILAIGSFALQGLVCLSLAAAEEPVEPQQVATLFQSLAVPTPPITTDMAPDVAPEEPAIDVHIEPPINVHLNRPETAASAWSGPGKEFALGAGDELKMTVWGYPELSEQMIVLPDGTVSYPLVGTMKASGLTAQQFGEALRQALEPHIDAPRVSVVIVQMRSRSFSVIGDVKKAGVFPLWNAEMNVLSGIAQAEGLLETALPGEVKIFRALQDGTRSSLTVDISALVNELAADPLPTLQPGDIIYVPGHTTQRRVCVLGEVNRPGLYPLTSGMTAIEAITSAGWVTPGAVLGSVMIVRREGGQQEFFRINTGRAITKQDWAQYLALKPGDIVYVPKQFFAKAGDFVNFFTSHVEPAARTYLSVYDARNPADVLVDR